MEATAEDPEELLKFFEWLQGAYRRKGMAGMFSSFDFARKSQSFLRAFEDGPYTLPGDSPMLDNGWAGAHLSEAQMTEDKKALELFFDVLREYYRRGGTKAAFEFNETALWLKVIYATTSDDAVVKSVATTRAILPYLEARAAAKAAAGGKW